MALLATGTPHCRGIHTIHCSCSFHPDLPFPPNVEVFCWGFPLTSTKIFKLWTNGNLPYNVLTWLTWILLEHMECPTKQVSTHQSFFFLGGGGGSHKLDCWMRNNCALSFLGISIRFHFFLLFSCTSRAEPTQSHSVNISKKASLSLLPGRMCSTSGASCFKMNYQHSLGKHNLGNHRERRLRHIQNILMSASSCHCYYITCAPPLQHILFMGSKLHFSPYPQQLHHMPWTMVLGQSWRHCPTRSWSF